MKKMIKKEAAPNATVHLQPLHPTAWAVSMRPDDGKPW
jgi:hypothetical protein